MVLLTYQKKNTTFVKGYRETTWEKGEVIGVDLYDAFEKACEAGADPNKLVRWREY